MIQFWGMNLLWACGPGALLIATVWAICRWVPQLPAATRCLLWWLSCAKLVIDLFWVTPIALPLLPSAPEQETITVVALDNNVSWVTQLSPLTILFAIWLAGVGIALLLVARQVFRVRQVLRHSAPITDPVIIDMAGELAQQMNLPVVPRLLHSDRIPGPLAVGLWQPMVLLPPTESEQLSPTELRSVLAHEFAHIRRHDLWLGILPLVVRTLFFFHPLAWLACSEYEQAQEAACDTEAIRASGVRRDDYGRLLLKLGTTNPSSYRSLALGVKADYRWMLRRLQNLEVLSTMSTSRLSLSLVAALGLTTLSLIPVRVTAKPTVTKKPAAVSTPTAKNFRTSFTMTAPAVTVKPVVKPDQGTTNRELKEVRLRLMPVKAEKGGKTVPSASVELVKIIPDKATVNGSVIFLKRADANTFITTTDAKNPQKITFKFTPAVPAKTNGKATVSVKTIPAISVTPAIPTATSVPSAPAVPAVPATPIAPSQNPSK